MKEKRKNPNYEKNMGAFGTKSGDHIGKVRKGRNQILVTCLFSNVGEVWGYGESTGVRALIAIYNNTKMLYHRKL